MADYEFTTEWIIAAPSEAVWKIIQDPQTWPSWWRGLESVSKVRSGEADGAGAVWRFLWRGALPYRLAVEIEIIGVEPPLRLEGVVSGALRGTARWQLQERGKETRVRFDWHVSGARSWMRFLAPVARPVFRWNHNRLMQAGRRGIIKHFPGE